MIFGSVPSSKSGATSSAPGGNGAARAVVAALAFGVAAGVGPGAASAQEDDSTSPSIEVGSSRIGGPGVGSEPGSGSRGASSWSEPDEYVTEENLPAPGKPKRLPSLHVLAERYYGGQQWKEACRFYGMILEEGGLEALNAKEGGQKRAARSYFECAESAFAEGDFERVEKNLLEAEKLGLRSSRHDALRRRVVKEQFRKKMLGGDVAGASRLYDQYQSMGDRDEDERIWFGEKLAAIAKTAFQEKDELTLKDTMAKLEAVAPLNTEYRALKAEIEGDAELFGNIALVVGSAVAAVLVLSVLSRWRARARVGAAGAGRFLDDDL